MFSAKVKDILRKDKRGVKLTPDEVDSVLTEVREFRNSTSAKDNPDYFTAVFIEIEMLKRKNGGPKLKSASSKVCA